MRLFLLLLADFFFPFEIKKLVLYHTLSNKKFFLLVPHKWSYFSPLARVSFSEAVIILFIYVLPCFLFIDFPQGYGRNICSVDLDTKLILL